MTDAPLRSFRQVIDLWPARVAMQSDLGLLGARIAPVREWHARDTIPYKWFDKVIEAAERRGFEGVTYKLLTDLYRARTEPPEAI